MVNVNNVAIARKNVSLKRICERLQQMFLMNNVDCHNFAASKEKMAKKQINQQ